MTVAIPFLLHLTRATAKYINRPYHPVHLLHTSLISPPRSNIPNLSNLKIYTPYTPSFHPSRKERYFISCYAFFSPLVVQKSRDVPPLRSTMFVFIYSNSNVHIFHSYRCSPIFHNKANIRKKFGGKVEREKQAKFEDQRIVISRS